MTKTIRIDNWNDPRVKDIRNDCMELIEAGKWRHHRLDWIIIVKSERSKLN